MRGDPAAGDLVRSPQLVEGPVHPDDERHDASVSGPAFGAADCSARNATTAASAVGNRRPSVTISSHRGSWRAVARVCGGRSANQHSHVARDELGLEVGPVVDDGQRRPGDGRHVEHERVGIGVVDGGEHGAVGVADVGGVQRAVRSAARAARAARDVDGPGEHHVGAVGGRVELGHPERGRARAARGTASARTPTSTAGSSPNTSPAPAVITATQNSMRSRRQNRRSSDGLISPATATTTMHPSVACGRSLSRPPRNSAQATARSAVDELADLRHGAGPLVDGGLREPAGRRHRAEERAGEAGDPVGGQLLVVVDRRLVGDGARRRRPTPSRGST